MEFLLLPLLLLTRMEGGALTATGEAAAEAPPIEALARDAPLPEPPWSR
jgi:hypothetical protein